MLNIKEHDTILKATADSIGFLTSLIIMDKAPHLNDIINDCLDSLGDAQLAVLNSYKEEIKK